MTGFRFDTRRALVAASLAAMVFAGPTGAARVHACPPPFTAWAGEARPYDLAVAPSGRVYALNWSTNQVVVHDASGAVVGGWGGLGSGHGQLNTPTGIAVDATGKVYVSDTQNARIEVFDANGAYLSTIQHLGTGVGQFVFPGNLATGPANDLFVVNLGPGGNKVVRYDLAGNFLAEWPVTVVNTDYDLAVDTDGKVYGMQTKAQAVVDVFNSTGTSLGSWSVAQAGETIDCARVNAHGGVVIVSFLDAGGMHVRTFDGAGNVQCPGVAAPGLGAIATSPSNDTYVGDLDGGWVYKVHDLAVPARAPSWGALKARYR